MCVYIYMGAQAFHSGHVEVRGQTKHRRQFSPFITSLRGHRPSDLAKSASLGWAICCPIFMLKHLLSTVPIEPKCFWSTMSLSSILNWDSRDEKCPQRGGKQRSQTELKGSGSPSSHHLAVLNQSPTNSVRLNLQRKGSAQGPEPIKWQKEVSCCYLSSTYHPPDFICSVHLLMVSGLLDPLIPHLLSKWTMGSHSRKPGRLSRECHQVIPVTANGKQEGRRCRCSWRASDDKDCLEWPHGTTTVYFGPWYSIKAFDYDGFAERIQEGTRLGSSHIPECWGLSPF